MRKRSDRQGMALLTVLLLVAVMSVIAVAVLDDVRFSVRRTMNAEIQTQGHWYAAGAQTLAMREIARLTTANPLRTPSDQPWNGKVFSFPIEEGSLSAVVRDGQTCFNLNSVVEGQGEDLLVRPAGVAQLIALGRAVGIDDAKIADVADGLVDWMDADTTRRSRGAEDADYASLESPYRTAGLLLAEVSELRAVKGVDAATYRRLRPFVCALPTSELSAVTVNSLTLEMAPLLEMLTNNQLSPIGARSVIAARPEAGWLSTEAFWDHPALRGFELSPETRGQATMVTRYFNLRVDVDFAGGRAVQTALIHARSDGEARSVIERWSPDE